MLVGATFATIDAPLSAAYDRVFRSDLLAHPDWSADLRRAIAVAIVGAGLWAWHWSHSLLQRDKRTTLWRVYVSFAGLLPGQRQSPRCKRLPPLPLH